MSEPCQDEFWDVYDVALQRVYGFLVRRTDGSTAEDLTQEVFVTAARTWSAGGGARVTLPWLLTVARSRLIDHYRAEQRRDRNHRAAWSALPRRAAASAEESSEAARLAPATEAALASLSGAQRAALVLHHLDALSVAEVAEILARSVPATESLLARARRSFRAALKESAG